MLCRDQVNEYGAHKTGNAPSWPGPEPIAAFPRGYARTYATAVAGEATSMYHPLL